MLLVQACQGMNPPEQQVESEYRWSVIDGAHVDALPDRKLSGLPQAEDNTNENIIALQRQIYLYKCHIKVKRPNTVVYTATADSYYATRAYFLKHMVKQLEDADGKTTFDTMVQLCSRDMSFHPEEECRNQAPMTYGLMRQPLILPPSNAHLSKQIKPAPKPHKGQGNMSNVIFYMHFMGKLSDLILNFVSISRHVHKF